jgi:integrase
VLTLLRKGNVLDLRWGDIDFNRELIHLSPERVKTREELFIPLAHSLKATLLELPKGAKDDLVFPGLALDRSFRNAAKRAGLQNVTFHCLRKTGGTLARRHGVPLEVVKKLGGWSVGSDVFLTDYRGIGPDELREAVDVLDKLVMGEAVAPGKEKSRTANP